MPESTSTPSLIVLRGLEDNGPATLFPLQEWLYPFTPLIERLWWILWFATITYVVINHVLVPLLAQMQSREKKG